MDNDSILSYLSEPPKKKRSHKKKNKKDKKHQNNETKKTEIETSTSNIKNAPIKKCEVFHLLNKKCQELLQIIEPIEIIENKKEEVIKIINQK